MCLHPVKLFLDFGHSIAPNTNNYVAALVLYETQGSVRGLNRWGYKWLLLSPMFNAKQHRWLETSYVFQVDPLMAEWHFLRSFLRRFSGWRMHWADLAPVQKILGSMKGSIWDTKLAATQVRFPCNAFHRLLLYWKQHRWCGKEIFSKYMHKNTRDYIQAGATR